MCVRVRIVLKCFIMEFFFREGNWGMVIFEVVVFIFGRKIGSGCGF